MHTLPRHNDHFGKMRVEKEHKQKEQNGERKKDANRYKLALALEFKEREEGKKLAWERSNVCKKCHIVKATNGKCSFCD